jgi:outer membrane lipase/esterase
MFGSSRVGLKKAVAVVGATLILSLASGGPGLTQSLLPPSLPPSPSVPPSPGVTVLPGTTAVQASICSQPQNQGSALCPITTGPAGTVLNPLTGGSLGSITPDQFNSVDLLGYASGNSELDSALRRLRRKRGEGDLSHAPRLTQYAAADPKLVAAGPSDEVVVGPLSMFLAARGGIVNGDDTATQRGFSGNTVGGQIGGDYRLTENLLLGGYLGYDHVEADFNASAGNSRADNYSFVLYGNYYATERVYLEGVVGYVYNSYATVRNGFIQTIDPNSGNAASAPTPFSAAGTTYGNQWIGAIGAGYGYPIGAATLTPYARLNYVQTRIRGFSETNESLLGNQIAGTTITSLTSVLGARASYAIGTSWGVLVPQVRGEYIHEFEGERQSVSTFIADPTGAALTIPGLVSHDYGKVGLSMTAVLPNGLLPYFDYEGLVGYEHYSQHIFTAGLRIEF